MKLSNKIAKLLAVVLAVGAVLSTNVLTTNAWTEVSVGNQYGTKVEGATTGNFILHVPNKGDTIELYKIGTMTWDATKQTYVGPAWDPMIQSTIDASATYVTIAATPAKLAEADLDQQVAFFNWLYTNKATNNVADKQYIDASKVVYSESNLTYTATGVPYGIYLVAGKNATLNKEYQLLTVNLLPTQEGPDSCWYMKSSIEASIKFADLDIDKYIDGEYGEVVEMDQAVVFDIYAEVPAYQPYQVADDENPGQTKDSYEGYPFCIVDTMADVFEHDGNTPSVYYATTSYKDASGNPVDSSAITWVAADADMYSMVFASKAASGTADGIHTYKDSANNSYLYANVKKNTSTNKYQITWYAFNEGTSVVTKLAETTEDSIPATVTTGTLITNYKTATGVTATIESFTKNPVSDYKDLRAFTFDYAKLKAKNAKYVKISYGATVTTNIKTGVDTNKNTATIYYQYDIAGSLKSRSDEAYAWTYALNLVKVDGSTDASNYTPLAGAKFNIYKAAFEYIPADGNEAEAITPSDAKYAANNVNNYANYVFARNVDGTTTAPSGKVNNAETATTLTTLEDNYKSNEYKEAYHRIVEYTAKAEADAHSCDVATCEAGLANLTHSHILVYPYFEYKTDSGHSHEIVSVADLDGVTIDGLTPGSYVLIETQQPTGYNKLKEAMRFEIEGMTAAQVQGITNSASGISTAKGDASLKGFMSDEEYSQDEITADTQNKLVYVDLGTGSSHEYRRVYADGVYRIIVKNYAGITLPSTGGMGTLLFTIIGIMIMTMVLVVVIVRRRGEKY